MGAHLCAGDVLNSTGTLQGPWAFRLRSVSSPSRVSGRGGLSAVRACEANNQLKAETSPQDSALKLSRTDRSLISVLFLLHPFSQGLVNLG